MNCQTLPNLEPIFRSHQHEASGVGMSLPSSALFQLYRIFGDVNGYNDQLVWLQRSTCLRLSGLVLEIDAEGPSRTKKAVLHRPPIFLVEEQQMGNRS